jgi:C-terminal processing protease CtpA/Prc
MSGAAEVPTIEFPQYDPGFACLIDDKDRPVVYYLDADGPASRAGLTIGMAVVSVNGVSAADAIKTSMEALRKYSGYSSERYLRYDAAKNFYRQMKRGEMVKLQVEDPAGKRQTFELPATLGVRYLPRLPVPIEGVNDSGGVEPKLLGEGIGYIYVRRIRGDLSGALDAALNALGPPAQLRGLIIDVRGNSGGGFDADRALRNFDPDDKQEPNRPRYAGPIALLIDERCISAGEGWSSWFFAKHRARAFGTATAGASSRKAEYTLSNGLYKVIVPVKSYTGFLDRTIERRGLEPDVAVRVTSTDLAAGRDTVLETARRWLREQVKPRE